MGTTNKLNRMVRHMIGMILCGGYGKRLYPLTRKIPKVLFELKDGYTSLDKQLLSYGNAGFDRVVLLTGHQSERIEQKYGSEYKGLKLEYVVEGKPLGTLNAIRLGFEQVSEDAIISNGDVVADINLKRMRQNFEESHYLASIFVTRMPSPYGILELGRKRVKSFKEKPLLEHYINGGFWCLSKDTRDLLEEFKVGNIEQTAFPRLAKEKQLTYYKEKGNPFWVAIDTMKDLEEVRKEYTNRIDKPWGYEKVLVLTKKRLEKEIFIMSQYRTSLHYHKVRDETLHVLRGAGWVEFEGGKRKQFREGMKIHIKPKLVHSSIAFDNTLIREISTPYPNDVIRVKDFYSAR